MGWIGLLVGLLGVWIMNGNGVRLLSFEIMLLLIVPISSSIFFVLQKPLLVRLKSYEVMVYSIISGALLLLINDHSFFIQMFSASAKANFAAVYLGVIPTAIAFNLWAFVLSKVDVSYASRFLYLVPLITVLFSLLILNQLPLMQTILGGIVILLGVFIAAKSKTAPVMDE